MTEHGHPIARIVRALRRSGNEAQIAQARKLLRAVHLIKIDEPLLDHPGDLEPSDVGTLDAIHLAAALAIGSEVGVVFAYDRRLAQAAEAHGFDVEAPR